MRRSGLALLLLAALVPAAWAQGDEKVIDVRASRPPAGNSFEALWAAYRRQEAAGDTENAGKLFRRKMLFFPQLP